MDYLPMEYRGMKLEVRLAEKVNQMMEWLVQENKEKRQ